MSPYRNRRPGGPYRSRSRVLLGVCGGLADHYAISAFWLRVFFLVAFAATGLYPAAIVYVVAGLIMKVEPVSMFCRYESATYGDDGASSRPLVLSRVRSAFESLDRRIQRIEGVLTNCDL